MDEVFGLCDEFGPQKVVHVDNPSTGLRAIVVIDSIACGPAIGGTRMAPDATLEECARLARAMTLKNAAAGLPHGGAKSVILADPAMPIARKQALMRSFAVAIAQLSDYTPGPDMGTDETCMAWVKDEIGRAVGLPRVLGGIPLDEIGATGFGVAVAAGVAEGFSDIRLDGAAVAIQGFGAVGRHAAQFLAGKGARLVAVADSKGAVFDPKGLDLAPLNQLKAEGRSVAELDSKRAGPAEAVIGADCDILIPAARPDVITEANAASVRAAVVIEGANIPATDAAEAILHRRGILVLPDFIANAGGVISAAVELAGGSEAQAMDSIAEKIARNTHEVLERAEAGGLTPRAAALALAEARVIEAMALRRVF
ncbi:Glu/Leu/Phe/Val dehydrogenase [Defluviimonas sp. WL0024]|uniref:Glutamate dehydrogenase n=2 Tax=Albidovulum TaxID=205889 RepID=A0ABT3J6E4_9RHOB|nr:MULTISPECIES: Glu/Leu/Phe/Val dehydrogenase [Defluviimonas]MCU9849984.1 Glu/Leu/Phe/Val dehydrogenase [Defluviimonas sp. WL0024]MCW3783258.1 Glu/Leu/Phe/Val dehydrogenase [Defluviimonas salinarum]